MPLAWLSTEIATEPFARAFELSPNDVANTPSALDDWPTATEDFWDATESLPTATAESAVACEPEPNARADSAVALANEPNALAFKPDTSTRSPTPVPSLESTLLS